MPYSLDLRQKVMNFVENGGTTTEAAHIIASIYRWLSRPKLEATKVKRRRRKLDWKELEKDVKQNPESKLADRAKKIRVNTTAIFYALKRMKITRKKTTALWRKKQRRKNKRLSANLEFLSKKNGSKNLVFIDKSGLNIIKTVFMPGQKKGKSLW